MKQLVQAWVRVTSQTIVNCFAKSWFTEQSSDDIEYDPFSDLVSTVNELREKDPSQLLDDVTPEPIVSVDDEAMVLQPYRSDREIVDNIMRVEPEQTVFDEDDDDDSNAAVEKPSSASVRAAMDTIIVSFVPGWQCT